MVEAEMLGMIRASESQGLVTRAQALGFLTERQLQRRLETRAWTRVFPSVYRPTAVPETWRQRIEALLLWAGKGAALSHKTAAAMHGLEGFPPGPLELTITRQLRAPEGVVVHRVRALAPRDVIQVDDLNVTSA